MAEKKESEKKITEKKEIKKKAPAKKTDAKKSETKTTKKQPAKKEVKESVKKEAAEVKKVDDVKKEAAAEVKAEAAAPNATLQKKRERREAKAARKAANMVEEKKSRPNNLFLGVLIFGVLVGMFAFVAGYNYFSKPASIEKYIEDNGGAEAYGALQMDEYTTAAVTAKGNNMSIDLKAEVEDEEAIKVIKETYSGDDGEEQLKDLAAYFLTTMKPETRGFGADATVKMSLNGEELKTLKMTYSEAKKYIKEAQEEAEEAAEEEAEHDHEGEDTEEAADDTDEADAKAETDEAAEE